MTRIGSRAPRFLSVEGLLRQVGHPWAREGCGEPFWFSGSMRRKSVDATPVNRSRRLHGRLSDNAIRRLAFKLQSAKKPHANRSGQPAWDWHAGAGGMIATVPPLSTRRIRSASLCVAAAALFLPLAACSFGAAEFRAAVRTIATQTGRDAGEVERAFRKGMAGADDASLAAAAEKAVNRSRWIGSFGGSLAVDSERNATLRAVTGATCTLLDLAKSGTKASNQDLEEAILIRLHQERLPETEQEVAQIGQGIADQLKAIEANGTLDIDQAEIDLVCALYG